VFARQNDNEDDGYFQIFVTPRANASLTEIEGVIDSIVAAVQTAPPSTAEVQRVKSYAVVGTITGLQQRLARAEQLAEGQVFDGDPLSYRADLARQAAVTPADVQRVARKYLGRGRVVLSMVPAGKLDQVSRPSLPFTNVTPAAAAAPATSTPGSN
jgi:zinc protease